MAGAVEENGLTMRAWRRALAPALLVMLLALIGAEPAAAALDPSFGQGGRLVLPTSFEGRARWSSPGAVAMPDGSLVVATRESLVRLTPEGQLDPSFGEGGRLIPSAPPGARFEIVGLALDSQNRLLVAGTSVFPGEEQASVEFLPGTLEGPREARILRLLPDGRPDPSFGDGGVVETDLGLPPPRDQAGKALLAKPWVELTGVAVDAQNRVVVTGGAAVGVETGCAHDWFFNVLTYAGLVARFTEAGAVDTGFGGGDGVFGGHSASENPLGDEFVADPSIGPGGEATYITGSGRCPRADGYTGMARLTGDGGPVTGFGSAGSVHAAVDEAVTRPDGSLLALESLPWREGEPWRERVSDYGPSGVLDSAFGRAGHTVVTLPGGPASGLRSLATDANGRVLLGGHLATARVRRGHHGKPRKPSRRWLLLMRLNRNGQLDRSLGPHGRVAIGFGALPVYGSQVLVDDQGRVVLVGTYVGEKGEGLAIARYLPKG